MVLCNTYMMGMGKGKVSESQKAAQKKYDRKTQIVSVKYTPANIGEYKELKSYLDNTGQSANSFIKGLIKEFFESGQDRKGVTNTAENNPAEDKWDRLEEYYPYSWIDRGSIQFLYDNFGEKTTDKVLDEFASIIEGEVDNIIEDKGCEFDKWIEDIEYCMNEDGFLEGSEKEICGKLIEEMCSWLF